MGTLVGGLVGPLVDQLVGLLVGPLVGQISLSPALFATLFGSEEIRVSIRNSNETTHQFVRVGVLSCRKSQVA